MFKKREEGHLSFWQILWKNKLAFIGASIIVILTLLGIFAGVIAKYDPYEADTSIRLLEPSAEHWFGTDSYGRDIFTRVIYGARTSLWLGLLSVGISALFGIVLGGIAGYYGKVLGMIIMRIMDALSAFPALILAICIATIIGRGTGSAIIAIGIVGIPDFARLMYSQTISIKERGFVEAGIALGEPRREILYRHIFPNCLSALIVRITIGLGSAIMVIAALSFLGLGVQPPQAEWGNMISEGRSYIISGEWWIVTYPGLAIALAALSFNLVGDGLRDILDPRSKTGS